MRNILIGSPVRQEPDILAAFLHGLARLHTDGLQVRFCFMDDNDDPRSSALLDEFLAAHEGVRIRIEDRPEPYDKDDHTHRWRVSLIARVAAIKNQLLQLAAESGFDALFLVDSDLVLHPRTLVHLSALHKPVVSEVFWTRWTPQAPWRPQVWMMDHYTLYAAVPGEQVPTAEAQRRTIEFLRRMRDGGCHPVGGLGACTLVARNAIAAGVSFDAVPNVSFWGEDRAFSIRAAVLGVELWADTALPPLHLYRRADLARVPGFWRRYELREEHGPRLTLALAVSRGEGAAAAATLRSLRGAADRAVVLLDADAQDDRAAIADAAGSIALTLLRPDRPLGAQRELLRRALWEFATREDPDWLLLLDPGETIAPQVIGALAPVLTRPGPQCVLLPVTRTADGPPRATPCLVRYVTEFDWLWAPHAPAARLPDDNPELPRVALEAAPALSDASVDAQAQVCLS